MNANNSLNAIVLVLNRPQEAGNIGAVIRAMKNMGLHQLRLVAPEPFSNEELLRVAHRCDDIIAQMTIHNDLDSALADTIYVVGTAAIAHHKRPTTMDIRSMAVDLVRRTAQGQVALLFGQEDDGLDNQALDRCHLIAMLPSDPAYPALNLAQSALLFLYELRLAAIGEINPFPQETDPPVKQGELERFFQLTETLLQDIDFFRYSPETVMRSLRRIVHRAALSTTEARLLIAIIRKLLHQINADSPP